MTNSRLWRHKRRIIFVAAGAMITTAALMGPGVMSALIGAGAAIFSGLIVVYFPWNRLWLESAALGCSVAAMLPLPVGAFPLTAALGTIAAFMLLYGGWSDRLPVRFAVTSKRQSRVAKAISQTWKTLVPGESHPDDYWSGKLIDFDHDPDDADTVYLRFETQDHWEEMTLTFLEKAVNKRARYLLERAAPEGMDDLMFTMDLEEKLRGKTIVDSRLEQDNLPLRIAMTKWFDDTFGDELDDIAATLSADREWKLTTPKRQQSATA